MPSRRELELEDQLNAARDEIARLKQEREALRKRVDELEGRASTGQVAGASSPPTAATPPTAAHTPAKAARRFTGLYTGENVPKQSAKAARGLRDGSLVSSDYEQTAQGNTQGMLKKRSPYTVMGIETWQARYFVLRPGGKGEPHALFYYKSLKDAKAGKVKGKIPSTEMERVWRDDAYVTGRFDILVAGDKHRVFALKASSNSIAKLWVERLLETKQSDVARQSIDRLGVQDPKFWKLAVGEDGSLRGVLKKRSPRVLMGKYVWQERYCAFEPSAFEGHSVFKYWRSEKDAKGKPAGLLQCRHMTVVEAQPATGIGRFSMLMENQRLYEFCAASDKDAKKWVRHISRVAKVEREVGQDYSLGLGAKREIATSLTGTFDRDSSGLQDPCYGEKYKARIDSVIDATTAARRRGSVLAMDKSMVPSDGPSKEKIGPSPSTNPG